LRGLLRLDRCLSGVAPWSTRASGGVASPLALPLSVPDHKTVAVEMQARPVAELGLYLEVVKLNWAVGARP
jgi:hypothetical protein